MPAGGFENMVRHLGEVLQTIGGYGFHIYDDGGARWITIRYETEDAATKARDLIAKALVGEFSVKVHG
jgi:N-acetylglucosamine kinase-like BadF-type ATPase